MEDYKFLADKEMKEVILFLENEYKSLKTGHINKSLFDKIFVNYYGEKSPLNQVSTITIPEARLVVIQPWDKTLIPKIEQAILNSDLSINPISDGSVIRIKVPILTNERRKELVKRSKKIAEDFRVRIRNIRQELNNKAKKQEKDSEITEDDLKIVLEEIQKITDSYIKKIDDIVDAKIKEIMKI